MAKSSREFEQEGFIVEEAIPAAIRIKLEILDARLSAIDTLGDLFLRRLKGLPTRRQRQNFQTNVIVLYQHLRLKFSRNDPIHKLDEAIKGGKEIKFPEAYDIFCKLQRKMESMKITKIEIKKLDDEKLM